jgi:UDP-3-O-[3-hydroxymyristoyl] glucosamine N-acyltransferase
MLVRDIAAALSARVLGDGAFTVERIVHPADAENDSDLAVAMSREAVSALATSKAQAAIVSEKSGKSYDHLKAVIVAAQERVALSKLTALFDRGPARTPGIHPSAVIAPDAQIGAGASIGPFVVVGARSRIGPNSIVLANVSIGADVTIGADSLIYAGVQIGDRITIGNRVILQPNAVVGCDGFSFVPAPGAVVPGRVHSLGTVEIGDDVEIGAGTTIARATLETTRIGQGTKIDNQVQVAHNVVIGKGCLICGMVGISGSVELGDRVLLAGGVGIADHVKIGSDAIVAAGSGVASNVGAGSKVAGYPAAPYDRAVEAWAFTMRHKRVSRDIEDLKSRLESIENSGQKKK